MTDGWRGDRYLPRAGSAKTYGEARARTQALRPQSWLHYLDIAGENGLPTEPHKLWPEEWEAGGRYAGYLGTVANAAENRDLVSGLQVRKLLGISRKTWRLLSDDLTPDAEVAHKLFYEPERVRRHVAANTDRLTKRDAIERLKQAVDAWN